MNHIFVSYSRSDSDIVKRTVNELKRNNINIWLDTFGKESGIPFSEKWFETVENAVYSASGAVIFRSEKWKSSDICFKEFERIQNAALPVFYIDKIETPSDIEKTVDNIKKWYISISLNKNEDARNWLIYGTYRFLKDKNSTYTIPNINKFKDIFHLIPLLKRSGKFIKNYNPEQSSPIDFKCEIKKFIKKVKTFLFLRIAALSVFAIAFICMIIALSIINRINTAEERNSTDIKEYTASGIYEYTASYEQINTMLSWTKRSWENKDLEARALINLLNKQYPVELSDEKLGTNNKNSDRYEIELSDNTSSLWITDKTVNTTKQLNIDAVPVDYSFNNDGTLLAVCASNKAYIYDLQCGIEPVPLLYNTDFINEISFDDNNRICAYTATNKTVVWNNPWLDKAICSHNLSSGLIGTNASGKAVAVYIEGNTLIINTDNNEEYIDCGDGFTLDADYCALSEDCSLTAVNALNNNDNSRSIIIISVNDKKVIKIIDSERNILGMDFSHDNRYILAADNENGTIVRFNVDDGSSTEADITGINFINVFSTDNEYIAEESYGIGNYGYYFSTDLSLVFGPFGANAQNLPIKQLDVAEKYNYMFTATRSGNTELNARIDYTSGNLTLLKKIEQTTIPASSSVAVSQNDEYVAFGTPNGNIYIYETNSLMPVWACGVISENIVGMNFEDNDNKIAVLGSSGTIYHITLGDTVSECEPGDSASQIACLEEEALAVCRKMYDLGLSDINPDE